MEGPLKFQIVSLDDSSDKEIHVDFKKEFLQLKKEEQATQFYDHVNSLKSHANKLEEDSQERQGLLFVLQFLEELVPRVQAGDIPLDETIIVKVMDESPIKKMISGLQTH